MKSNYIFIFICLALGVILRVIWVSDMEWKDDEKLMYELAYKHGSTNEFPSVGMMSGGGVVNPGISVAFFALLSKVSTSPLGLARGVQWMNVAALFILLWFIYKKVEEKQRLIWLLGLALAAVSPMAILFSRKIWAQDMLPFFTAILIVAIHQRSRVQWAFVYGLLSALIGQIHMSGFFLAFGWGVFSLLYDLYHRRKIQYAAIVTGGLVGVIPMIPWLNYISTHKQGSYLILDHVLQFRFYIYSFLDALGLNLVYTFEKEINAFYQYPGFYLVAVIYLLLSGAALFTLWLMGRWIFDFLRSIQDNGMLKVLFNCSEARFYTQGIFIGLGLLMTFSGTEIYAHYLICIFPFTYIWLSRLFEKQIGLFKGIVICQAVLSVLFLLYVHQNNGIRDGDYGITYKAQQNP